MKSMIVTGPIIPPNLNGVPNMDGRAENEEWTAINASAHGKDSSDKASLISLILMSRRTRSLFLIPNFRP
ncbi:MAG: hypothetical protein H7832_13345 [Magnetococcus sp. DMHC-6]